MTVRMPLDKTRPFKGAVIGRAAADGRITRYYIVSKVNERKERL